MATNRIKKELENIRDDPPSNCSAAPKNDDDIYHWDATIIGPAGSVYEGGIFNLDMKSFHQTILLNHQKLFLQLKFTTQILIWLVVFA